MRDLRTTVLALLAVLLWEWGGQDMAMAAWFGTAAGFAGQHSWVLETLLHRWPHDLAWGLLVLWLLQLRWPQGFFRRIPRRDSAQAWLAVLLALLLIQIIKHASPTSCPWSLREFGGQAQYLPHWRSLLLRWNDGGGGHCFPAGSASVGFAFFAAYPFIRSHAAQAAKCWLLGALAIGFVLGWAQQMRGAHFMSHTLWSAWLCWSCGMVLFWLRQIFIQRSRVLADMPLAPT